MSLSWDETDRMLTSLAKKIKSSFKPDFVVGVARGGLVPAVRLSHLLGDKNLRVIQVKYYKNRKRLKKPNLLSDIKAMKGNVLVVDDVADTGNSLRFVLAHVRKKCDGDVKFATIACKPSSGAKPDFFVFETEKWIIFPWETSQT